MKIQINTDNNIEGGDEFLNRLGSRWRAHWSDSPNTLPAWKSVSATRTTATKAAPTNVASRLEGMQPVAVTYQAGNMEQAVNGAADKLGRLPSHTLARLSPFPHCRRAFLSWSAAFLAMAFLSVVNVFAAPEATTKFKQSPPEKIYGTWVAKDVDAKVGEVTITLSFREEGGLKLVAWSELILVGKVREMKGPYKVRGDTISSKAIRGGTKVKFWFEGEKLVLQFEDGKIVRFRRETENR